MPWRGARGSSDGLIHALIDNLVPSSTSGRHAVIMCSLKASQALCLFYVSSVSASKLRGCHYDDYTHRIQSTAGQDTQFIPTLDA